MKKIGVISDTHFPSGSHKLPVEVVRGFSGVALILHAGDIQVMGVLDSLELIAPVKAVCGNCDFDDVRALCPPKRIIKVEKCRIGLIHSLGGSAQNYSSNANTEFDKEVNCVVFGHSHRPYNENRKGKLLFNPGSPTDKRKEYFYSYGILTVDGGNITGEIMTFS